MEVRIFFTFYFIMVLVGISVCLGFGVYTKESLRFTDCEFIDSINLISLNAENVGTTSSIPVEVLLNYHSCLYDPEGLFIIPPGETRQVAIFEEWSSDFPYTITVITKRGNVFHKRVHSPIRQPPLEIEKVTWNYTSNVVKIVTRNTGTTERKILSLGIGDAPNGNYLSSTSYTDIGNGTYVPLYQTATIIVDWPSRYSPWVSGKTYYFIIWTETGSRTEFTSRPP